jgi:hypothetical protein
MEEGGQEELLEPVNEMAYHHVKLAIKRARGFDMIAIDHSIPVAEVQRIAACTSYDQYRRRS